MNFRLFNHGHVLPGYVDTRDPEAVRGTNRVRSVDPNLLAVFNREQWGNDGVQGMYQVWGPSVDAGGWVPLLDVMDDYGKPYRGVIPWELVVAAIVRGREEGEGVIDRILAHNERLQAADEARRRNDCREGVRYFRRAIAGEVSGWGRWSAEDVARGYRSAKDSEKAAPVGQRVFVPGVQPATGG